MENTQLTPTQENFSNKAKVSVLKEARESKGLSLEAIHEATKIPMDALRAIEEGYSIRNLSPFYLRGFIKIYANYLNIDLKSVIENYHREELPKQIKEDTSSFDLEPIEQWFAKIFSRINKRHIGIALGIILALFLVSKGVGYLAHRPKSAVKPNQKITKVNKAEKKELVKAVEKISPPVPKVVEPKVEVKEVTPPVVTAVPSSPIKRKVTLTARAKKASWLKVKADGETVFQGTLNSGSVETWIADNKIEISGKNVNQLEFELNGKMIGTIGREDRRAKGVVVTKDGLSVAK